MSETAARRHAPRGKANKDGTTSPRGEIEILKNGHGGARKGAGKPKGVVWPSTVAKAEAREQARQYVTAHLQPILESLLIAALGTRKLMLRREDGTWRESTAEDDIEKALNGDPDKYWIAPSPPSVPAASTLLAYGLDKPTEHVETKLTTSVADLTDEELRERAAALLRGGVDAVH